MQLAGNFAVAFAALFVVVEPFGTLPFFSAVTAGRSSSEARTIALRATVIGGATLIAFAVIGRTLLDVIRVRIEAFQIAGGLLLLLTAFEMLRGRAPTCRGTRTEAEEGTPDPSVVPLAFPLLAGPGAMVTVLAHARGLPGTTVTVAAIIVTFAVSYLVLRAAELLSRALGRGTLSVLQRVLGLVVAAMSVQSIATGAASLLRALR
jgi:multiple antibiotic resistance protein